jgi:phage-related protein
MATMTIEEEFKFPHEKDEDVVQDDKFEVEIEDDTPAPDRGRKTAPPPEDPTDEELSSYDEKVQQRIKKFTRGYHDERRAKEAALREREAAENFAKQVYEENQRLKGQLKTGSEVFIEQNKSTAQMELEAAKKRYKEAYESGDADGVAEAQMQITKATLKIDRAEQMRPIEEPDIAPPPQQTSKPNVSPRTQKWIEQNSDWFGADEEMTMAAMGLDRKLKKEYGDGYAGTEEYFRTIDKTMRKRFPEHFNDAQSYEEDDSSHQSQTPDEDDRPTRRATKPTSPVAPATRSTPPNRIRLKASEAAIARKLGVPIEEYAKQVANLKRNA